MTSTQSEMDPIVAYLFDKVTSFGWKTICFWKASFEPLNVHFCVVQDFDMALEVLINTLDATIVIICGILL